MEMLKIKPTQLQLKLELNLYIKPIIVLEVSWSKSTQIRMRNKLSRVGGWVVGWLAGWLEMMKIKPTQPS